MKFDKETVIWGAKQQLDGHVGSEAATERRPSGDLE